MAPSPSDGCDPLGLALRQDPEAVLESPQLSGLKLFGWSPAPYCAHFWKRRSSKRSPLSIQDLKIFDLSFEFPSKGSIPEVFLWQTAKFLQWPLGNRSQDVFFWHRAQVPVASPNWPWSWATTSLHQKVKTWRSKGEGWGVGVWFFISCVWKGRIEPYIYIYVIYLYMLYIYVIYIYMLYTSNVWNLNGDHYDKP